MAGQAGVPPRVHKRSISDQQRRREIALERQKQSRRDLQQHARQLASGFSPPSSPSQWDDAAHDDECSRSLDQQDSMLFQVSSFGPLAFLLWLLLCVGICFVFGLVAFMSVCLLMTVFQPHGSPTG
jgi:nitrate reductase NapE component